MNGDGGGGGVEVRFRGDELILRLENMGFGENVIWFCFSKDRPIDLRYISWELSICWLSFDVK